MPPDGPMAPVATAPGVGLLSVVSLTWRDAPGSIRGHLGAPMGEEERRSLKRQGDRGIAEVHTCARSTWILS